ncbi:MAG: CDP-alcohol phosphatidyltransferase family protein [Polyangiaceae bacterium]
MKVAGLPLGLRLALDAQAGGASAIVVNADSGVGSSLDDARLRIPRVEAAPVGARCVHVPANSVLFRGTFKRLAEHDDALAEAPPERDLLSEPFPHGALYGFDPMVVSDDASRRRAERALFRSLRKPEDGWTSRYLNRHISLTLSRWLVHTPLTPNQISLGILAIGLGGALAAASGTHFGLALGAFLLQTQSVLDGCDGEVSRVTHRGSKTGEWLDTIGDDLSNYGFFAGSSWGLYRLSGSSWYLLVGAVILGCGLLSSGIEYAYLIKIRLRGLAQVSAEPRHQQRSLRAHRAVVQARHLRTADVSGRLARRARARVVRVRRGGDWHSCVGYRDRGSHATAGAHVKLGARLLLAGALLAASTAHAELPPAGSRIQTHDYSIDLSQTPVLAGTRVTGLSGAYVAIGEGIDGVAQNPGAISVRTPWATDHFDFDVGLGITFSSALARSDVFNSGQRTMAAPAGQEELTFLNLAAVLQFGRWGFGVSTDLQSYSLDCSTTTDQSVGRDHLLARFAVTHSTVGYAFHDSEWLIGGGLRGIALDVVNTVTADERSLFAASGVGLEGGLLLRPNGQRYRVGVCYRAPVNAAASITSERVVYQGDAEDELYLPSNIGLPWELNVGVAVELGARPLNPPVLSQKHEFEPLRRYYEWQLRERRRALTRAQSDAEREALAAELDSEAALDAIRLERERDELGRRLRERARGMARSHFLLSASLDILGPMADAVGVESFLERTVQRSGRRASFSPRLGLETEAIRGWTRLRAGSYLEPTRFDGNPNGARPHFTIGFDQRLFRWEVFGLWTEGSTWMLSASLDVARKYVSSGIGVGMWH